MVDIAHEKKDMDNDCKRKRRTKTEYDVDVPFTIITEKTHKTIA